MPDNLPAKKTTTKSAGPKKYAATRPVNNTTNVTEKTGKSPAAKPKLGNPVKRDAKNLKQGGKLAKKAYTGSFESKFAPRVRPSKSVVTYRHIIALEFWIGLIIILTGKTSGDSGQSEIVEAAAFTAVFAMLFGVSAAGRNPAKVSAGLGGLIVLTLAIKSTGTVGNRFGSIGANSPDMTPDPNPPETHTQN